jgi:hypothetical protein
LTEIPLTVLPVRRLCQTAGKFLAQTADEVGRLPPGSAIQQMLADYQVMRDQARAYSVGSLQ